MAFWAKVIFFLILSHFVILDFHSKDYRLVLPQRELPPASFFEHLTYKSWLSYPYSHKYALIRFCVAFNSSPRTPISVITVSSATPST